jgi:exonuclease III
VKIISLNIHNGGGHKAAAILDWLISRDCDVIVLPEWRDNKSGALITSGLQESRFSGLAAFTPPRRNGVFVAAKSPFTCRRVTPSQSEKGELVIADLAEGYKLLAAYFPQLAAKRPFFVTVSELVASANNGINAAQKFE